VISALAGDFCGSIETGMLERIRCCARGNFRMTPQKKTAMEKAAAEKTLIVTVKTCYSVFVRIVILQQ
jgi:hypothetical protein